MALYRDIDNTNIADPVTVLSNFGFTPIPLEKVVAYKAEQLLVHNGNFWFKLADFFGLDPKEEKHTLWGRNRTIKERVHNFLITVALVAGGSALLWAIFSLLPLSTWAGDLFWHFGGASCVVCLICLGVQWVANHATVVYPGVWNDVAYYPHSGIPGWANDTVTNVRALYPDATFTVSELREEKVWGLLDPILWTRIEPESAPIALAVWNEKGERVDL